jgi:hypothetical protein
MTVLDRLDVLCRALVVVCAWSGIAALLHRWGWISLAAAILVVAPAFTIGNGTEPLGLSRLLAVASPTAAYGLASPDRWTHVGLTAAVAAAAWVALVRRDRRIQAQLEESLVAQK